MTRVISIDGPSQAPTARPGTAPREILVIVSAGVVLASLDLFIVNVALPQIALDLHASNLGELSWVLNGYAIVYASLLVFFGRLADRYRRDRGFLLGVAIFTFVVRCLRSIDQCGHAARVPSRSGCWRGAAHADIPRTCVGLLRA